MNLFFRQSLRSSSRSLRFHYFTFINNDVEKKKKYIEVEENRQHVSPSIEEKIKKNTFIFRSRNENHLYVMSITNLLQC